MAVFEVGNTTASNEEVAQYQLGSYISSNEAVWRILSFSIHERYPTVVHLAVHLENGQRVYFTSENFGSTAAESSGIGNGTTLLMSSLKIPDEVLASTTLTRVSLPGKLLERAPLASPKA
ncbi:uncharacterized protein TNCT_231741 [Trichonephila clavata]|uniref:Uncharacterized protein n=1 Tax=Trichonephila clavata TaxID=2740835 RepID=A0A8X6EXX6_TRICU|nr:uncharacterized protein TNCT_231741 [Trichonephila clavata]